MSLNGDIAGSEAECQHPVTSRRTRRGEWPGVFEVGVFDVPARKRDLVEGTYEVAADAASPDPVAVRITDMLGEEILVLEPR